MFYKPGNIGSGINAGEYDDMVTGEEDTADDALNDMNKYLPVEPIFQEYNYPLTKYTTVGLLKVSRRFNRKNKG